MASIRDVARLAGVSHQTVSRVINGHSSIRGSTKQRVLEAMHALQYRPNRTARALATGRSRKIGILATASASYYGLSSSIHAVQNAAQEHGYFVTTANVAGPGKERVAMAIEQLLIQPVDGVVVMAPQAEVFDVIEEQLITVPFVTMQTFGRSTDYALWVDQLAGAHLATRHLIELGHRRIYHLAGPQAWMEAQARLRGYEAEMRDHGLEPFTSGVGDWTADSGYAIGTRMLSTGSMTAVFSANDQMALGLLHACRESGRRVPEDISIVGFDDIPESCHYWPPLTTIHQDFSELGRRCVNILIRAIDEGGLAPHETDAQAMTPDLVVRQSTAAPD